MKDIHKTIQIPAYRATLHLVVSENMAFWFTKLAKEKKEDCPDCGALVWHCNDNPSVFILFFEPPYVRLRMISHEVFHLTHRILQRLNSRFDIDNHEHFAECNAYLMQLVCNQLEMKIISPHSLSNVPTPPYL